MAATGYKPGPVSAVPHDARPAAKPAKAPAKTPVKKVPPVSYIDQAVNRLGTPLTDSQIQANAQSQVAPIIKALTDSIGQQAQSGTAAIGGYTSELAKQLGGFQQNAANIYGGAQSAQAASDAALSQKLSGEGGAQAQALGQQLASINAPGATGAAVQDATQTATGAGNALYATGSASLANLIASGAAEQSYAGKLPGIAGMEGLQQTGQLQGSLNRSLADQTGQLQAKVPGIVAGLQTDRQNLRGNRETLRQNLNSAAASNAAKQQALEQERQALGLPDASLSRAYGYAVDKQGNPVGGGAAQPLPGYHSTPGGGVAKDVKAAAVAAKKAHPTLTPYQATTIAAKAAKEADDLYHGTTKPNSKDPANPTIVTYTQTYQDAIKTLLTKYPTLGRAGVLKLVNTWYKPGEFGRPAKPARGTTAPPGYQPGTYGKAPSTPANPGGYLPKGR